MYTYFLHFFDNLRALAEGSISQPRLLGILNCLLRYEARQVPRWTSAASGQGRAHKTLCARSERGLSNNSRWELLRSFEAACRAKNCVSPEAILPEGYLSFPLHFSQLTKIGVAKKIEE